MCVTASTDCTWEDISEQSCVHIPQSLICNFSKFRINPCPQEIVFSWDISDFDTLQDFYPDENRPDPRAIWRLQQADLTEDMRAKVLDWMMQVCCDYFMKRETFHSAVWILDGFLSSGFAVSKRKFQLVAVACIVIAAKMEEVETPSLEDYAQSVDYGYTIEEIRSMEMQVLSLLKWKIRPRTLSSCVNWTLMQWDRYVQVRFGTILWPPRFKSADSQAYQLFRYCVQLTDAVLFKSAHYSYPKSHLSASILYLGLSHSISTLDDSLETDENPVQDKDGILLLKVAEDFIHLVFGIREVQDMTEELDFVWKEGGEMKELELPTACDVLDIEQIESHFEDFSAYQTYTRFLRK